MPSIFRLAAIRQRWPPDSLELVIMLYHGPIEARIQDPYPSGIPEKLTATHMECRPSGRGVRPSWQGISMNLVDFGSSEYLGARVRALTSGTYACPRKRYWCMAGTA